MLYLDKNGILSGWVTFISERKPNRKKTCPISDEKFKVGQWVIQSRIFYDWIVAIFVHNTGLIYVWFSMLHNTHSSGKLCIHACVQEFHILYPLGVRDTFFFKARSSNKSLILHSNKQHSFTYMYLFVIFFIHLCLFKSNMLCISMYMYVYMYVYIKHIRSHCKYYYNK